MPPRFLASLENPLHPGPRFRLGRAGGSLLDSLCSRLSLNHPRLHQPLYSALQSPLSFTWLTRPCRPGRLRLGPQTPDHACTLQAQTRPARTSQRPVTATLSDSGKPSRKRGALGDRCPGEPTPMFPICSSSSRSGGPCLESGLLGLCACLDNRTWQNDVAVSRLSFTKWVVRKTHQVAGKPQPPCGGTHLGGHGQHRLSGGGGHLGSGSSSPDRVPPCDAAGAEELSPRSPDQTQTPKRGQA